MNKVLAIVAAAGFVVAVATLLVGCALLAAGGWRRR